MRLAAALPAVLLAFLSAPPPAWADAEAYRWVDAAGTVHLTQDPTQVPQAQRPRARVAEMRPLGRVAIPGSRAEARSSAPHAVPFEDEGHLMRVTVQLNDRVSAPFYVDTGATEIVLTRKVAEQLGDCAARTGEVTLETASGKMRAATLQLRSVRVGDAEVADLRATISPSLEVGLLGGTFLSRFRYSIDPDTRILTLHPRDRAHAAGAL